VVARDPAFHSYNPDYLQVLQALEKRGLGEPEVHWD
jgi:hypothetical protein